MLQPQAVQRYSGRGRAEGPPEPARRFGAAEKSEAKISLANSCDRPAEAPEDAAVDVERVKRPANFFLHAMVFHVDIIIQRRMRNGKGAR